jgi:signal transduction histidine kinase
LRQADRNKDDFLATLAHEMLNPLSASRVGLQLLSATLADGPQTRVLAVLQRQYSFLAALVEDLLDVSRIRLGKVSLKVEDVVLQDAVSTAIETCQHRLEANSHDLQVAMPHEVVTVRADRHRLVQVVTNILINAAKFTPPGGKVLVEVKRTSASAEITVTDDGIGMTTEQTARAFDLFQQHSDGVAKGGLGIGLALVRQLVELQGGTVYAHSPGPSQGTSITIRFPIAVAGGASA